VERKGKKKIEIDAIQQEGLQNFGYLPIGFRKYP
jgi:hypothetical protein